jgi:hypothetical protein
MSAAVGFGTLGVAGLLYKQGKPFRTYTILCYFALMEFLQLAQYAVADQCDNRFNQWLTLAAFVHTAFQPYVINLYFLYGQVNAKFSGRHNASGGSFITFFSLVRQTSAGKTAS